MQNDIRFLEIPCLIAKQPIGEMFVGVIDSQLLYFISQADVRRLLNEDRDVEEYIGIQRKLNPNREKEIAKYVNLYDATFPNSIILSVSSEHARYNSDTKMLELDYLDSVAKILDGQHRIAGLQHYESAEPFECIVTIYIDMDLEDQAIVFATINKEQQSVSKSLVADLYAFAKSRSPQKTAHNIARALNFKEGSPFYKKIKILGTSNSDKETITQATFVENVIKYISRDPQADRNFYKIHEKRKLNLVYDQESKSLFLRNIFINDETDYQIAQLLWNYFNAVNRKWETAWSVVTPNMILNRSTGFIALMKFFKNAYLSFNTPDEMISTEQFYSIFELIDIDDNDFTKENYVPGSSGQSKLYKDLLSKSGLE